MITPLTSSDIFQLWFDRINSLITDLGDKTTLSTAIKSTIVAAINEVDGDIGNLSTLSTAIKTSVVAAINEVDGDIGDKSTLTTTNKTSLVVAVNELDAELGNTALNTTATTISDAINEVYSDSNSNTVDIGDKTTLTTSNKSDLVVAVNELDAEIGSLATLDTTDKSSLVDAVNELRSDRGLLPDLESTSKTTIISAINEIITSKLQLSNNVINGGRGSDTEDLDTKIVATFATPTTLNSFNSSTISQYGIGKFVDDNSTNGGAGAALETEIIDFITATGRIENRYGVEYYLSKIDAGNGVDVAYQINDGGDIYNAMVTNNEIFLGSVGDIMTWAGWVKLESTGDSPSLLKIVLGNDSNVTTWIDDVIVGGAGYQVINTVDAWVHVRQQITLTKEYEPMFPAIYGSYGTASGTAIAVGLPVLYNGDINIKKAEHVGLFK